MNVVNEFLIVVENDMAEKRKRATINGIPVSDRYLTINGEPVWAWRLTVHATEEQIQSLKTFLNVEGIIYE